MHQKPRSQQSDLAYSSRTLSVHDCTTYVHQLLLPFVGSKKTCVLWRDARAGCHESSSRHRSEAKGPVNRDSLRARGALDHSGATAE